MDREPVFSGSLSKAGMEGTETGEVVVRGLPAVIGVCSLKGRLRLEEQLWRLLTVGKAARSPSLDRI